MRSGTTTLIAIKCVVDTDLADKVIFTLKGNATVTKTYPLEVTYSDGIFTIPLTQEDTVALSGNTMTRCIVEGQINYKDKSVAKTSHSYFSIEPTLATEIVEGNTPNGSEQSVSLEVQGNVIIAKVDGSVSEDEIATAIAEYFESHPTMTESEVNTLIEGKGYQTESEVNTLVESKGYVTESYHDSTKQDTIADLDTIRANALKGASALQSVPSEYAKMSEVESKGYQTESEVNSLIEGKGYVSDLSNYYTKAEIDSLLVDGNEVAY